MRGYSRLTSAFAKSQLREPVGFFFLLMFSPLLLVIFGLIFGNAPKPEFGGHGMVENMLPGVTVLSLMMAGIMSVPMNQVSLRASGALRRLRVTPLKARTFVAADLTVNFLFSMAGALMTILIGLLAFHVAMPRHVWALLGALVLGLVAMLTLGYALAALYPSVAAATGIGNVLMIVLMLTSGAFIPTQDLPAAVRTMMTYSPVHHMAALVRASWIGQPWPALSVWVLVGVTVAFGCLATTLFRWGERR